MSCLTSDHRPSVGAAASSCSLAPLAERARGATAHCGNAAMVSLWGLASSLCMLLLGFLVGHFELHTTVPSQLVSSFTHMEHKVTQPAAEKRPHRPTPHPPSLHRVLPVASI